MLKFNVCLTASIAVGVIFCAKPAIAITAAQESIRDLGGVVNHSLGLPTRSATEDYLNACNENPEDYRIRVASVFGANELGQMAHEFGIPNQCHSSLGEEEPSTGRFIHTGPDGTETQLGSGHTVHRGDVVVTASHFLRYSNGRKMPAGNVIFRVYEGTPGNCREVDYPISSIEHGADDIQRDVSNDFAVIKLSRPVTTYMPLELPDEELVLQAQRGRKDLVLMGFPKHEATRNGRDYSAVGCRGQLPPSQNIYFGNPHVFVHDCDSTNGSSGGAFTVIEAAEEGVRTPSGSTQRYRRYFVGLQQGHGSNLPDFDPNESSEFSAQSNFNTGITLNPKMRLMIEDAAGS